MHAVLQMFSQGVQKLMREELRSGLREIADKENRCFCEPIELGIARQYLVVPLINLERPPARRGDQSVLEKRKMKIRDGGKDEVGNVCEQ
jgi:hypothetical protein